jgi:hypothetical protein
MDKDLAIYCVCFPKHEPLRKQKYQHNIMCNATTLSAGDRNMLEKKGYVFDDTGDNISTLNPTLGDLTATYWIWKNAPQKIVGTSQYRRFWDDSLLNMDFDQNTLYVQDPIDLQGKNLREQYIQCHGEIGLLVLEKLARENKIPISMDMLVKAYAMPYLYGCNMFIAHKTLYDKFCELLFEVVFEVYDTIQHDLDELGDYNKRSPAFVGERVVNIIIANKEHFFPNLNIMPVKWRLVKNTFMQKLFK